MHIYTMTEIAEIAQRLSAAGCRHALELTAKAYGVSVSDLMHVLHNQTQRGEDTRWDSCTRTK